MAVKLLRPRPPLALPQAHSVKEVTTGTSERLPLLCTVHASARQPGLRF